MINLKKHHKYLGFIMLLPFVTWAITGVFFFIKPGYSSAYEKLAITTYPVLSDIKLPINNQWSEIRRLHSVIGEHLLVKEEGTWRHLTLPSMVVVKSPTKEDVQQLVTDAIKHNLERYGEVKVINNLTVTTSTDVNVTLNWDNMTLCQRGPDTEFISMMYQIHYLKWTGIKALDNVLGIIGLALVALLAFMGVLLSMKRVKRS